MSLEILTSVFMTDLLCEIAVCMTKSTVTYHIFLRTYRLDLCIILYRAKFKATTGGNASTFTPIIFLGFLNLRLTLSYFTKASPPKDCVFNKLPLSHMINVCLHLYFQNLSAEILKTVNLSIWSFYFGLLCAVY